MVRAQQAQLQQLDNELVVLQASNSSGTDEQRLWRLESGDQLNGVLTPLSFSGSLPGITFGSFSGTLTLADDKQGGLLLLATADYYGESSPPRLLHWPAGSSMAAELQLPFGLLEADRLSLIDLGDRIQLEVLTSSANGSELRLYQLQLDRSDAFQEADWLVQLSQSAEQDLAGLIRKGRLSGLSLSLMSGESSESPAVALLDVLETSSEVQTEVVDWVADPAGRTWLVRAQLQIDSSSGNLRTTTLELLPVDGGPKEAVFDNASMVRVELSKAVPLAGVGGVAITDEGLLLAGTATSADDFYGSPKINLQWLPLQVDQLASSGGKLIAIPATNTLELTLEAGIGTASTTVDGLLSFSNPSLNKGYLLFGSQPTNHSTSSEGGSNQLWTLELPGVETLESSRETNQLGDLAKRLSSGVQPPVASRHAI